MEAGSDDLKQVIPGIKSPGAEKAQVPDDDSQLMLI